MQFLCQTEKLVNQRNFPYRVRTKNRKENIKMTDAEIISYHNEKIDDIRWRLNYAVRKIASLREQIDEYEKRVENYRQEIDRHDAIVKHLAKLSNELGAD